MKRLYILFLLMVPATTPLYSQILKTFKENYDEGNVTYQYYENRETSEQIKHGVFSYTKYLKADAGTYSEVIRGHFKNGNRDGLWSFSIKRIDYPNSGGTYTTEITTSTQPFKNGIPDGLWKINSFWKVRDKVFWNYHYIWGKFDPVHVESASLTFVNGVATGTFIFNNPKSTILHLNKNGFIVGNYIFPGVYNNTEITFNHNGVITKFVERNKSGKVESKMDFDADLLQTGEKYLSGTISKEELNERQIKADTVGITNYLNYVNPFEQDYFILPTFGGDKSYYDNGYKTINIRIYGRYILFERLKP